MTRVNPLSVTLNEGAPVQVEGSVPQGLLRPKLLCRCGIPLPRKSKGVVVPMVEEEDPNVYKDVEDPKINTLFKESNSSKLRAVPLCPHLLKGNVIFLILLIS